MGQESVSVRDQIPAQVVDKQLFLHAGFFAHVLGMWANLHKDETDPQQRILYVNSGAPVRWQMLKRAFGLANVEHVQSTPVDAHGADELHWNQYERANPEGLTQAQDLILYSVLSALSKLVLRDFKPGLTGESALVVDTINIAWDEQGKPMRMEKPHSYAEACEQVDVLTSGKPFLISNATVVGKVGMQGEIGTSVWLLPARFVFAKDTERDLVRDNLKSKLQQIFAEEALGELRPGGLSSVDEIWLPYLQVGLMPCEAEHEVQAEIKQPDWHLDAYIGRVTQWVTLADERIPDWAKIGLGATVIGASMFGIKRAIERYVRAINTKDLSGNMWRALIAKMVGVQVHG